MTHSRRNFVQLAALATLGAALPARRLAAQSAPYGPLGLPDVYGVRLPAGFSARLIGIDGELVTGTLYPWHKYPDGSGTFPTSDGGWILVSNSEENGNNGGASAVRFNASGTALASYRIFTGGKWVCAGGITPWGTWLACEEYRGGYVWECDPTGTWPAVVRPALGKFVHEAAAIDPESNIVYLTEDEDLSRLYRFLPTPNRPRNLETGRLQAAQWNTNGTVTWHDAAVDRPDRSRNTTAFLRLEGCWFDEVRRALYFTTTTDDRVWELTPGNGTPDRLRVIYDGVVSGGPLREPDNITVHAPSGDLYVAEDNDDLELVLFREGSGGTWSTSTFLQLVGHDSSEVAGPAFNPDGTRLYFSSQRGLDGKRGMTFEVTGPFRLNRS